MAVLAAVAAAAPAAQAGTYDVWSCRGPDGSAISAVAWEPEGSVADTCAAGGSLRVTPEGAVRFAPPAGTRIAGYELWRSAQDNTVPDDTKLIETAGTASFTVSAGTVGNPGSPLSAANRVVAVHTPLDAVTLRVACHDRCLDARMDLYRSHVTIDDPLAPTASAAVAGDDAVIVSTADRGGGVAAVTLSLDGGPPQTLTSGCAPPYTSIGPCPQLADRAFAIDAPDGPHSASGTVIDAAGNLTAWGPLAIVVHRATAPVVAPASEPEVLSLSRRSVDHARGATVRLAGTLRTGEGAPVAGARLAVSSLDLAADAAVPRALAPVITGDGGAFAITLRRDGAQRITVTSPGGASATATLRARLALGLRSNHGRLVKGRLLTLSGALRGAGASARGTVVTIESIVNGRWLPVGAAHAKPGGRYRWDYRFVHLARDTIFSFRAVVERAPGWPWPTERSAPLKVRVDVP